jgi:hypothetical protein
MRDQLPGPPALAVLEDNIEASATIVVRQNVFEGFFFQIFDIFDIDRPSISLVCPVIQIVILLHVQSLSGQYSASGVFYSFLGRCAVSESGAGQCLCR